MRLWRRMTTSRSPGAQTPQPLAPVREPRRGCRSAGHGRIHAAGGAKANGGARVTSRLRQGHCSATMPAPVRTGACAAGKTVTGDRGEHRLHVFGQYHRPPCEQRPGAARGHQQQTGTRRQPALHSRRTVARAPRCRQQRLHIVEQGGRDVHVGRLALPRCERRRVGARCEIRNLRATVARQSAIRALPRDRDSRVRSTSGSGRVATPATDRRRSARWDSASRSRRTAPAAAASRRRSTPGAPPLLPVTRSASLVGHD